MHDQKTRPHDADEHFAPRLPILTAGDLDRELARVRAYRTRYLRATVIGALRWVALACAAVYRRLGKVVRPKE